MHFNYVLDCGTGQSVALFGVYAFLQFSPL